MRYILILILLLCNVGHATADGPASARDYRIAVSDGNRHLDTLSIVEESFRIWGPDDEPLDPAFYQIDFISTRLQLRVPEYWQNDSIRVAYRVWPVNFSSPIFHRDTSLIRLPGPGEDPVRVDVETTIPETGLLQYEGLNSSGSITRGLTMGNRQDPVLNSAMNLQLSGMLFEGISINAAISDQNIPFQPEGSTQQLQDFDKVFINVSGHGASVTAGDFEIERPAGYFMNLTRRSRGAMFTYRGNEGDSTVAGRGRLSATAAGAIARGKYARNLIQGQEGNQGPYRLTGNNNESYIMILSGSEKVFIDGVAMQRGMDRDYIIDYNTATITFMPGVLITRDSRITVEFEYAERNYARSVLFSNVTLDYQKASFRINIFSEQDHKNRPLFDQPSPQGIVLMSNVGDSISKAYDLRIDSIGFRYDRVMYRLTDTLGYAGVLVYSTDTLLANYVAEFSYMGEGQGNYRPVSTAANGRVYEWVAPVQGTMSGSWEPLVRLVTPKSHRMLSAGGEWQVSNNSRLSYEYAVSERDINLFSAAQKGNDAGQAFRIELSDKRTNRNRNLELNTGAWYEFSGKYFTAPERYRGVEFERDWNSEPGRVPQSEHLPGFRLELMKKDWGKLAYAFRSYLRGEEYRGYRNELSANISRGRNQLIYNGSLLNSHGLRTTTFYRHRALYSHDWKFLISGIEHQTEHNSIAGRGTDLLLPASDQFSQWEIFIAQPTTSVDRYRLFYRLREDAVPLGNGFEKSATAHNYGLQYQFLRNENHRINLELLYRDLQVGYRGFEGDSGGKTLNARGDYFSRWAKGAITSVLFYETAGGRERRREYMYLEVPAGQGAYLWVDYNNNGIRELDEFEQSPYPEEANFIRIFIPTDQFVPVSSTAISHSLNIDPVVVWRNATGIRKLLSRFSNRLNYRIDSKKQGELSEFNPFVTSLDDSLLLSLGSVVRNSLFFNRSHPLYSLEWTILSNRNKNLLSNGFESRITSSQSYRGRWNLNRVLTLNGLYEWGERSTGSEFFITRNYNIGYYTVEPSVTFQPMPNNRASFFYSYGQQHNKASTEQATTHRITLEDRISFPTRGTLQLRYQIQQIKYPFEPNTPVAFEMLQGLRQGTNHLWYINWQHNLNSYLQLSLQYNGRKPPGVNTIHTGSVQLRALF